jgi:hypothetical protein
VRIQIVAAKRTVLRTRAWRKNGSLGVTTAPIRRRSRKQRRRCLCDVEGRSSVPTCWKLALRTVRGSGLNHERGHEKLTMATKSADFPPPVTCGDRGRASPTCARRRYGHSAPMRVLSATPDRGLIARGGTPEAPNLSSAVCRMMRAHNGRRATMTASTMRSDGQRHAHASVPPVRNALPMNGSMRPKYMTPMDRTSADAPGACRTAVRPPEAGSAHARRRPSAPGKFNGPPASAG